MLAAVSENEIAIVTAVKGIAVIVDDVTAAVKVGVEAHHLTSVLQSARKETGVKAKARQINWFPWYHSPPPCLC